jgi:hypothetical protein
MKRVIAACLTGASMLAFAGVASAQTKTIPGDKVTKTATVEAIERSTRALTLKGAEGNYVTVTVPTSVQRFDAIKVGDTLTATYYENIVLRVKRPGVRVRARRGYMAATPAAASTVARGAAGTSGPAIGSPEVLAARAVEAAIAPLSGYTRDVPLRLQLAAGWKPNDSASAAMWVVGALGGGATMGDTWAEGFDATVTLTTPADATVGTARISVPRGGRTFRVAVTASRPLVPAEYVLRVGARAGATSIPSRETARLTIPAAPEAIGALFVRRGASTGNKEVPTADLRFRRSEQVRVEIPTQSSDPVTARLLDRTGKALAVPVTAAVRDDADGSRWVTAQLALAPLAPADYAIEITRGEQRMISAFRVVP